MSNDACCRYQEACSPKHAKDTKIKKLDCRSIASVVQRTSLADAWLVSHSRALRRSSSNSKSIASLQASCQISSASCCLCLVQSISCFQVALHDFNLRAFLAERQSRRTIVLCPSQWLEAARCDHTRRKGMLQSTERAAI